ncbi:MAG: DsbA family protein [Methylocystis sp.]|nr:DsbA family protein [Methylocystis sp.]MBI3275171.1 DsbA family protein [Methylocystis sp.]
MLVGSSIHGMTMANLRSRLSRRAIIAAAGCWAIVGFAGAALAERAAIGKVPLDELMAANALPDIVEGKADAPVTIVEYASMTCSHCATFHKDVYPTLKKTYIDAGKVKFILREFPLDPLATAAFMLARASGDKRDAVVDLLFAQLKNWASVEKPLDALANVLKQTGMSQEVFQTTLKDRQLYENVSQVRDRAAEKFGIGSTPTFFINGDKYAGEITVADLNQILAPLVK